MASKGQWEGSDRGRLGQHGAQPAADPKGAWSWWQALLLPAAFTLAPAASTPFYEVISVLSIERRLLNTSFVLARKQVFTADLSKAKNHFKNFFPPSSSSFPSDFFPH